jgi:ankyrin repeat protein
VEVLLERGADIWMSNIHVGWTPLNAAAYHGYCEVVRLLLERGADMSVASKDRWTPLHSAADKGHFEVV